MKYYLKNDRYIYNSDEVIKRGTEYRKITEVQVGLDRYKTYYKQVGGEDVIPVFIGVDLLKESITGKAKSRTSTGRVNEKK
jgi:hypothetical protein